VAVMNTHVSFPRIYGYEECLQAFGFVPEVRV
jgi:hypothetical protein